MRHVCRRHTTWLLLVLAAVTACQASPEVRKQDALARGERYLVERKLDEAIIEFQNALQADPQFVSALHGLGRAYAAKYWHFDAVRELGRARELAPDSVPIAVDLGRELLEIGDWAGAEEQARAILGREPENREALHMRAAVLVAQGKLEEGLQVLDGVPGSESVPAAELARAEALLGLDRAEQAEQILRSALARHPDDARSVAALGVLSLAHMDYAEAERFYTRARDLQPEDPQIRLGLAAAMARQGRVDEAILELEAVAPRARTGSVLRALARYYLDGGRPAEAVQLLAPVVAMHPRYAHGRFLLAQAYLASQEPERARLELETLERQRPEDPVVQLYLASVYGQLNRPGEALTRLAPLAETFEREPEYHLERARLLALVGRLDAAQRAAEAALHLEPRTPQPYIMLGEIRYQQGDVAGAREMLTTAASLAATYAPARLALGRLLLAEQNSPAALREFEAALELERNSLQATQLKVLTLVQEERMRDALAFVQAAIRADPRARGLHALLGALHMIERRWDAASSAYRKELDINRQSVDALLGLASAAMLQNREEEAVGHLREVVRIQPDHVSAVLLLASLYSRYGRADLAVPILEAAERAAPEQASVSLPLADLYVKTGRHDEAIALGGRVLEANPALTQARIVRGQAHLAKGDGAGAFREFQELVRADPGSAEAHYHLAHAHLALGRTAEAQAAYREALRLDPSMELARLELASLDGEPPDEVVLRRQLDRLRGLIRQEPRNALFREALARTLLVAGRTREAREELAALLAQAPLHVGANFLSARLLLQEGRDREARDRLEAVLRTNPDHVEARVLLARDLQRRGLLEDAIWHFEAAVNSDAQMLDVVYDLGVAYAGVGRLDEAVSIARQLERARPRDPGPRWLRGVVLLERKDFTAALSAFEAALTLNPQLADAHRGAGQAQEGLRQPARAAEAYRRALKQQPDDPVALNNLAWVLAESLDRPDEALPLAERATRLAPRSGEVLDTLGRIHYRRGDYARAAELLREARERLPESGAVQHHLGLAYAKLGRREDAVFALRRAAELDPELAEAERLQALVKELER
jgi:tetratricopeptide (TPR) repeat protein